MDDTDEMPCAPPGRPWLWTAAAAIGVNLAANVSRSFTCALDQYASMAAQHLMAVYERADVMEAVRRDLESLPTTRD